MEKIEQTPDKLFLLIDKMTNPAYISTEALDKRAGCVVGCIVQKKDNKIWKIKHFFNKK